MTRIKYVKYLLTSVLVSESEALEFISWGTEYCLKKVVLRCCRKEFNEFYERTEPEREFQIVGALQEKARTENQISSRNL